MFKIKAKISFTKQNIALMLEADNQNNRILYFHTDMYQDFVTHIFPTALKPTFYIF